MKVIENNGTKLYVKKIKYGNIYVKCPFCSQNVDVIAFYWKVPARHICKHFVKVDIESDNVYFKEQ
jgi:uncharacterized protein YjfI (DUF2170 family)